MLAGLWSAHPDELRADMQQYYGIDWDRRREHTATHVAALAAQLPGDARTFRAENPDCVIDYRTAVLMRMEHGIRTLAWMQTKDGQKGRKRPKAMELPSEQLRKRERVENAIAWERLRGGDC